MVRVLKSHSLPIIDVQYRERTVSLLYIATCTLPDILFATSTLAQHSETQKVVHWMIRKHIFCFLRATEGLSIVYGDNHVNDVKDGFIEYKKLKTSIKGLQVDQSYSMIVVSFIG